MQTAAVEPLPEEASVKAPPTQRLEAPLPDAGSSCRMGPTLKFKGEILGEEDLYIDGEMEGDIRVENSLVTIGPNGKVKADIKARGVVILGWAKGNVIVTDRTEIRNTGALEGDLVTARVIIEEDAVFRGSIDIVKPNADGRGQERKSARTDRAGDAAAKETDGEIHK